MKNSLSPWLLCHCPILHHKVPRVAIISESEVSIMAAMFTPLHSSMNQELFKKYVYNQSSHYEKYDGAAPETEVSIALLCQQCSAHYTAA